MIRRLSSLQTFYFKFIFPPFWIGLCGLAVLSSYPHLDIKGFPIIFFLWIAVSAFIYWSCIRLKKVGVDENYLYVSNYLKEISVPVSQITDVTENVWINSHPVTIHFQFSTEFG